MTGADTNAAARQHLLVVLAMLLESLFDRAAVQVLATLKPTDMRAGGARIPGTSYELPAETSARAMQQLLAMRGARADALLQALAEADVAARLAALTGKLPPQVSTLYANCKGAALPGSESIRSALTRLYDAAGQLFTLTQMRRIDDLLYNWGQTPHQIDDTPVQQFVAQFVRNAPP